MIPIDLKRFIQVCGMMGSDGLGERAAAAEAATKMLRSAGLTWEELLRHVAQRVDEESTADAKGQTTKNGGWRACDIVRECAKHMDDLTEWQRNFVMGSVPWAERFGPSMRLSPKQWAQFHKIIASLEADAS